jgi:hypothetical protein
MKVRFSVLGILIILIAAGIIVPVSAAVSSSGATEITANSNAFMSISLAGNITNWHLQPNADNIDNTNTTISITSNTPGWTVTAIDANDNGKPSGFEGRMVDFVTGTGQYNTTPVIALGNNLNVLVMPNVTHFTNTSYLAVGASPQTIATGNSTFSGSGDFPNNQVVWLQHADYTDPVLGLGHVYKIIVTFTGSSL